MKTLKSMAEIIEASSRKFQHFIRSHLEQSNKTDKVFKSVLNALFIYNKIADFFDDKYCGYTNSKDLHLY